jgi:integrase
MFTWAMKEGSADQNPVINTSVQPETDRERVLSNNELATIWKALDDPQYSQYTTVAQLLLLTGQRKSEIAYLKWSEVDFDKGVILLPGERTKNKRPHILPMSTKVAAILAAQPRIKNRDFVFGSTDGGRLANQWGKVKDRIDRRIAAATSGVPHWVFHDFRRTCATGMAELGVQPHIVEAVLNHVSGHKSGIAGIYNRAIYAAEKAQALALWATHLAAIVESRTNNVVALQRQA